MSADESLLSQERGLKYLGRVLFIFGRGSLLSQERGLKYWTRLRMPLGLMSLLSQERGLKCLYIQFLQREASRSSRRSVD